MGVASRSPMYPMIPHMCPPLGQRSIPLVLGASRFVSKATATVRTLHVSARAAKSCVTRRKKCTCRRCGGMMAGGDDERRGSQAGRGCVRRDGGGGARRDAGGSGRGRGGAARAGDGGGALCRRAAA